VEGVLTFWCVYLPSRKDGRLSRNCVQESMYLFLCMCICCITYERSIFLYVIIILLVRVSDSYYWKSFEMSPWLHRTTGLLTCVSVLLRCKVPLQ
jgi:hypothetical protein